MINTSDCEASEYVIILKNGTIINSPTFSEEGGKVYFEQFGSKVAINREIVEAIKPKVVIPMHYKTPALKFELNELGDCIKLIKDRPVHYMRSSTAHLSADTLGSDRVIVLDYSKE